MSVPDSPSVELIDSHWKATTEGASQTVSCNCLQVQKAAGELCSTNTSHACEIYLGSDKSDYYGIAGNALVVAVSVTLSVGSVCRLQTPPNNIINVRL